MTTAVIGRTSLGETSGAARGLVGICLCLLVFAAMAGVAHAQDPEPMKEPELKPRPRLANRTTDGAEPFRSPEGAAARSAIWPGWGQFHLGNSSGGALFTGGALVALALGFELVELSSSSNTKTLLRNLGWGLYVFDATLAAVDAYKGAQEINRENGYELFEDGLSLHGPKQLRGAVGDPSIRVVLWDTHF